MIDGSAPHRVFKIGELTRLIARQLISDSQESAVDLACACRYLEEPVLSTVWETQDSLCILLRILPRDTWEWDNQQLANSTASNPNFPGRKFRVLSNFSAVAVLKPGFYGSFC